VFYGESSAERASEEMNAGARLEWVITTPMTATTNDTCVIVQTATAGKSDHASNPAYPVITHDR
jgi:hypothetical protein